MTTALFPIGLLSASLPAGNANQRLGPVPFAIPGTNQLAYLPDLVNRPWRTVAVHRIYLPGCVAHASTSAAPAKVAHLEIRLADGANLFWSAMVDADMIVSGIQPLQTGGNFMVVEDLQTPVLIGPYDQPSLQVAAVFDQPSGAAFPAAVSVGAQLDPSTIKTVASFGSTTYDIIDAT